MGQLVEEAGAKEGKYFGVNSENSEMVGQHFSIPKFVQPFSRVKYVSAAGINELKCLLAEINATPYHHFFIIYMLIYAWVCLALTLANSHVQSGVLLSHQSPPRCSRTKARAPYATPNKYRKGEGSSTFICSPPFF